MNEQRVFRQQRVRDRDRVQPLRLWRRRRWRRRSSGADPDSDPKPDADSDPHPDADTNSNANSNSNSDSDSNSLLRRHPTPTPTPIRRAKFNTSSIKFKLCRRMPMRSQLITRERPAAGSRSELSTAASIRLWPSLQAGSIRQAAMSSAIAGSSDEGGHGTAVSAVAAAARNGVNTLGRRVQRDHRQHARRRPWKLWGHRRLPILRHAILPPESTPRGSPGCG